MRQRNKQLLLRLTENEKENIINYAKLKNLNINIAIVNLIAKEMKNCEKER